MTKDVQKWADSAMYAAEPVDTGGPKVHLLWMTPDPLGAIAATCGIYEGRVVRSLADVTDEDRLRCFEQIQKTHLKAPFEFVHFHFLIEGVTRAFTHQMVRQRTATYAQESLRFAVKEDMPVGLPPSLAGTERLGTGDNQALGTERDKPTWQRNVWDMAISQIHEAYAHLVDSGMPAEDARGLLPTNVLTRIHYRTDLRGLLEHAGNRLCTQAQFEWRLVLAKIAEAIRGACKPGLDVPTNFQNRYPKTIVQKMPYHMADLIADLLRPICYQTGKCEFRADFDRKCTIRNRVDANAEIGRSSSEWHSEHDAVEENPIVSGVGPQSVVRDENNRPVFIGAIQPAEWLLDPGAAR